ncbi:hypothetical protein BGW38_010782 [Lunasporangiospora selenospora]|uniref:Uncharacterized protein n=1 Tax=Lunasporangiospora selenospora TaxID=979761 RepID=A0A9P6KFB3_9FUNG|nr:hypothetical protein BGW38_010782 [Lunasporangiospora selenospora]
MARLLFRALTKFDEISISSAGLHSTCPNAKVDIKTHVERGGFKNHVLSQYISTTKDLQKCLEWVTDAKSTLAVIFMDKLDSNIQLVDLSNGHDSLSKRCRFAIRHKEVLVSPFINAEAIQLCKYNDLVKIFEGNIIPDFVQALPMPDRCVFLEAWKMLLRRLPHSGVKIARNLAIPSRIANSILQKFSHFGVNIVKSLAIAMMSVNVLKKWMTSHSAVNTVKILAIVMTIVNIFKKWMISSILPRVWTS